MVTIPRFDAADFDSVSDEMLSAFDRDGVLVLENMVSVHNCNQLKSQMATLLDQADLEAHSHIFSSKSDQQLNESYFLDSANDIRFFLEEDAFDESGKLRQAPALSVNKVGHALHDKDPVFSAFSRQKKLETLVLALGIQAPLLLQSMYIFKQPHIGGEVLCHQDSPYLWTEPASCIGLWFALEDATLENGCLWGIAGQHKEDTPRNRLVVQDGISDYQVLDDRQWPEDEKQPLDVKAGSLIVLHGQFPHLSGPNRSSKSRQAYALHVIDGACHYPENNWIQRSADDPIRGFG